MGEGRGMKVKWKVLPFFTTLQTKMRGFRLSYRSAPGQGMLPYTGATVCLPGCPAFHELLVSPR